MALDYEIKDTGHSMRVTVNGYDIAEIYYQHERCVTPLTQEFAESVAKTVRSLVETEYPSSELNEEDYPNDSLFDLLSKGCEDDSCDGGTDFLKLMLLSKLMSDLSD